MASSCIAVAGMGMIAQLYSEEKERSKVMGYVLGGIAVGVIIGYPFGGVMYDFIGKTAPFLTISMATAIVVLMQMVYILPLQTVRARRVLLSQRYSYLSKRLKHCFLEQSGLSSSQDESSATEEEDSSSDGSIWTLLIDPYIIIVTGSVWFSTTAMAMLEPCLPIWLMHTIHPEKWQLGTVFLPDSVGYFIGTNYFAVFALKVGRYRMAMAAMLTVGVCAVLVTFASSMYDLILPHFGLGLGIGLVDSALMPLLARLVDVRHKGHAYGTVYAIAQTAVSLAYGLGPLIGGQLVEVVGFPAIMQTVGVLNIVYVPFLFFLSRVSRPEGENEGEEIGWGKSKNCTAGESTVRIWNHLTNVCDKMTTKSVFFLFKI